MTSTYFPFHRHMIEVCCIDGRVTKYLTVPTLCLFLLSIMVIASCFLFLPICVYVAFALCLVTSKLGMSCKFNSFWRYGLRPPK